MKELKRTQLTRGGRGARGAGPPLGGLTTPSTVGAGCYGCGMRGHFVFLNNLDGFYLQTFCFDKYSSSTVCNEQFPLALEVHREGTAVCTCAHAHIHTRVHRGGALPPTTATPLPPMRHPLHQRLDLTLGKAWGTQRHTRLDGHHLSPVQGHSGFFLCVLFRYQASLPTSGRTSKGMWTLVGQGYGHFRTFKQCACQFS